MCYVFFSVSTNAAELVNTGSNGEAEQNINIAIVIPSPIDSPFWRESVSFAKAAANNLSIAANFYEVKQNSQNRYAMNEIIGKVLLAKPDYLVSVFWLQGEKHLLNAVEESAIPLITVTTDMSDSARDVIGAPTERYSQWLAHFGPDDTQVGYQMGKRLIKQIKRTNNSSINLIALTGNRHNPVSYKRLQGLELAVKESKITTLYQSVFTDWSIADAHAKTSQLNLRHENISGIWTANAFLALGAIEALNKSQRVTIVTTDWAEEVLQPIKNGKVDSTFGGHFTDLGLAITYAYDHHNKNDFPTDQSRVVRTKLSILTKSDITKYAVPLKRRNWQDLNFKQFSRTHNPNITQYEISPKALLEQLNEVDEGN